MKKTSEKVMLEKQYPYTKHLMLNSTMTGHILMTQRPFPIWSSVLHTWQYEEDAIFHRAHDCQNKKNLLRHWNHHTKSNTGIKRGFSAFWKPSESKLETRAYAQRTISTLYSKVQVSLVGHWECAYLGDSEICWGAMAGALPCWEDFRENHRNSSVPGCPGVLIWLW